jgi:hypothetical protein
MQRLASDDEAARLRQYLSDHVLPRSITSRIIRKHQTHVENNREWPVDTTPEDYAESLRAIVLDPRSGIYLEYSEDDDDWTVYLVGRARRQWRGPSSGGWIVVIFNIDRGLWITGFQPKRSLAYIEDQPGFWARLPR